MYYHNNMKSEFGENEIAPSEFASSERKMGRVLIEVYDLRHERTRAYYKGDNSWMAYV